MLSVIGKGSYGKVLLVKKKDNGTLYAVKVLKKRDLQKRNQIERTMTERRILVSRLFKPNHLLGIGAPPLHRQDGLRLHL